MKAVIFFSGLAGLILFGPPVLRHHAKTHDIHVIVHDAKQVHEQVTEDEHFTGQGRCRFEAERHFSVSASDLREMQLRAGSGSLVVTGVEGLGEVRGVARACASSQELLDDLRLTSETDGASLRVETIYPDQNRWDGGNRYARLDLSIEVPYGLAADIQDGSGEATISNLGSLTIQDGSGELTIEGIQGELTVADGSGELKVYGVAGPAFIADGSGELTLADFASDLEVQDSSGEIEIRGIGGSVTLHDSSGEVYVEDVAGFVRVVRDGSGSIDVRAVGGDFIVERDGSGSISHEAVEGLVDIPKKRRDR